MTKRFRWSVIRWLRESNQTYTVIGNLLGITRQGAQYAAIKMLDRTRRIPKHQKLSAEQRFEQRKIRFWMCVQTKADKSVCWLWLKGTTPKGYGRVKWLGKDNYAHRVAFFLHYGHWAKGDTMHTCDVRTCCNPYHLKEGTRSENIQDCWNKGRAHFQKHPEDRRYPKKDLAL